jgi:trimeric autotransporter adhesin
MGREALFSNTSANRNIGIGNGAIYTQSFNNSGVAWDSDNIGIGFQSLYLNQPTNSTNGYRNIAIGTNALRTNTTGSTNVAIGYEALRNNETASSLTAVGYQASRSNTTGSNNTSFGALALRTATTASSNVAIGSSALYSTSLGDANLAIGVQAGSANTTGTGHIYIGFQAGSTMVSAVGNTFVGYNSASGIASGTYNTLLGYGTSHTAGITNATAIGNGATVDASNKIRLGNTSVTLVETYGSFVTVSDRRLKTNISDNPIGLNFIKAVRPVQYELKAQKGVLYDGFIAQELDSILQKQNIKSFSGLIKPENTEGGHYNVSYATFVVPLVNAVKELDAKNEQLTTENEQLKAELAKIKAEKELLKISVERNTQDIEAIKAMLNKKQN